MIVPLLLQRREAPRLSVTQKSIARALILRPDPAGRIYLSPLSGRGGLKVPPAQTALLGP